MGQTAGRHGAGARALSERVSWWYLAGACAATVLSLLTPSEALSSFLFDAIALAAARPRCYGILRNHRPAADAWLLIAIGITLLAAGDVVYDVAVRQFGAVERLSRGPTSSTCPRTRASRSRCGGSPAGTPARHHRRQRDRRARRRRR